MKPTQYQNINNLLDILLSKMQQVLGEKLVGLYLYGSLVIGDFDESISDIDLLAVLESELNDEEFKALQKMHEDFASEYKEWDNRIEVQYMPKSALKTFKTQETEVAIISPGESFHLKKVGKRWLINWYLVSKKGVTIFGPSPKSLIPPISKAEFIQTNKEHIKECGEWVKDMHTKRAQAYAILTMCRALYAIKFGEQPSKKQAALWAEKELPQWSQLIKDALIWRVGEKESHSDDIKTYPETEQFVNYVISLTMESRRKN